MILLFSSLFHKKFFGGLPPNFSEIRELIVTNGQTYSNRKEKFRLDLSKILTKYLVKI